MNPSDPAAASRGAHLLRCGLISLVLGLPLGGGALAAPQATAPPAPPAPPASGAPASAPDAAPAAASTDDESAPAPGERQGRQRGQRESRRSVRDFSPAESAVTVDAATANLRQFFTDLGADAAVWYQHVQTLANPYFEGRAPGSAGMERAADYVEFWMKQAGLAPAFPPPEEGASSGAASAFGSAGSASGASGAEPTQWTSHRQWFSLPGGDLEVRRAHLIACGESFRPGEDFIVTGSSGAAEVEAPLAFVGYGLKEGENGYTSFDGEERLDGRIALLLRYEPLDEEGRSQWSSRRFSQHAAILPKLREVVRRGAAGVIVVNPPGAAQGRDTLETPESSRWGGDFEVPIVQATPGAVDRILAAADPQKRSLLQWRRLADAGQVKTEHLAGDCTVKLAAEVVEPGIATCNIGGVLPGRGELADEWLVIGAHYDHVGFGHFGTAPSNRGQLHPGADDNASGTSALLVLARRFADAYREAPEDQPLRSILFLAFTAEESGLHGSRWYTRHPTVPADRTTAMINLDMVGRLRSNQLAVSGTGTAEGFAEILQPHFEASELEIEAHPSGRGPSDHQNFYAAGIPVLFPFTGLHEDYHSPRDKASTVNPAGAVRIMDLVESIAMDLVERPDRLIFRTAEQGEGTDRGYGPVRLGVQPAMGEGDVAGVLVEAVSEGTAAAEAGILPGDVLIGWNGEQLESARSLGENLRNHRPGDAVQIVLLRNGERMVVTAVLKASRRRTQE